jgi:hypothetical protein
LYLISLLSHLSLLKRRIFIIFKRLVGCTIVRHYSIYPTLGNLLHCLVSLCSVESHVLSAATNIVYLNNFIVEGCFIFVIPTTCRLEGPVHYNSHMGKHTDCRFSSTTSLEVTTLTLLHFCIVLRVWI